jgi:hypothetical protein
MNLEALTLELAVPHAAPMPGKGTRIALLNGQVPLSFRGPQPLSLLLSELPLHLHPANQSFLGEFVQKTFGLLTEALAGRIDKNTLLRIEPTSAMPVSMITEQKFRLGNVQGPMPLSMILSPGLVPSAETGISQALVSLEWPELKEHMISSFRNLAVLPSTPSSSNPAQLGTMVNSLDSRANQNPSKLSNERPWFQAGNQAQSYERKTPKRNQNSGMLHSFLRWLFGFIR